MSLKSVFFSFLFMDVDSYSGVKGEWKVHDNSMTLFRTGSSSASGTLSLSMGSNHDALDYQISFIIVFIFLFPS